MRRVLAVSLALTLVAVACGGSGSSDTTEEPTTTAGDLPPATTASEPEATTTTEGEAETTTTSETTNTMAEEEATSDIDPLSVMPQECLDVFIEYVQALEPQLNGLNPNFLSQEEIEAISTEIDPIQAEYDEQVASSNCPQTDLRADRDLITVMLDVTAAEAPGALPMMGWVADLAGYYDDAPDISTGDCDADLATVEEMVAAETDGPRFLSMGESIDLENLANSLEQICPDRYEEYFSSDEWAAWAALGTE